MAVEDGALVCLLGPSGCGKTTVLRAIAGFEPVSQGPGADCRRGRLARSGYTVPPERRRLGMVFQSPAVDELYGFPVRIAALAPSPDRLPLLLPANGLELETNLAGGAVTAEGLTMLFCEEGYSIPSLRPGSEPCKRVNMVVPGFPAMIVVSWSQKGGTWNFSLPEATDLSQFSSISLRAALDPLSELNEANGVQAFTIRLLDKNGNTASVHTRLDAAPRFAEAAAEISVISVSV